YFTTPRPHSTCAGPHRSDRGWTTQVNSLHFPSQHSISTSSPMILLKNIWRMKALASLAALL
ncbi:hypothetical protein FRB91_008353, partial [Serendipita sp. 411]